MTMRECFPDPLTGDYQPASGFDPKATAQRWLVLFEGEVLPCSAKEFLWDSLETLPVSSNQTALVTGSYKGKKLGVLELAENATGLETTAVRSLLMSASSDEFATVSHALQIYQNQRNHAFCGRCGHAMQPKEGEWAQVCPECRYHSYPIISPCVIVAITRGDNEVLLVKHHRHQKQQSMHTLVAGFIEPGESAEAAVKREVFEETGLEVSNISYKYSQTWPFPHALMMGFHAEYKSGELQLEDEELSFGDWFQRDNLPELPSPFSISRYLVELLRK